MQEEAWQETNDFASVSRLPCPSPQSFQNERVHQPNDNDRSDEVYDALYPAREMAKNAKEVEQQKRWDEQQAQYEQLKALKQNFNSSSPLPKPGSNQQQQQTFPPQNLSQFASNSSLPRPGENFNHMEGSYQRSTGALPHPTDVASQSHSNLNSSNFNSHTNSFMDNSGQTTGKNSSSSQFSDSFASLLHSSPSQSNMNAPNYQNSNANELPPLDSTPLGSMTDFGDNSNIPQAYRNFNSSVPHSQFNDSTTSYSPQNYSNYNGVMGMGQDNLPPQHFTSNSNAMQGSCDDVNDLSERIKRLSSCSDFHSYQQQHTSMNSSNEFGSQLPPSYSAAENDETYAQREQQQQQQQFYNTGGQETSYSDPTNANRPLYQDIDCKNDDIMTEEEWQLALQNSQNGEAASSEFPTRDQAMFYGEVCVYSSSCDSKPQLTKQNREWLIHAIKSSKRKQQRLIVLCGFINLILITNSI